MADLLFPDIAGSYMRGNELGQQQRIRREGEQRRNRLAELAGLAYGAAPDQRAGFVQQAVATDPAAGFQLGQSLQTDEDSRTRSLVNMSRLLTAAPEAHRPGIYQQMMPSLQRLGLSQLPPQYDESVASAAKAIVSAYANADGTTPAGLREFQGMTTGLDPEDVERARRIALGLDPRPSSAAIGYREVTGPDGRTVLVATDPRAIGATTIGGGPSFGSFGGPQSAPQAPQQQPYAAPRQGEHPNVETLLAQANQMVRSGTPNAEVDAWLQRQLNQAPTLSPDIQQPVVPSQLHSHRGGALPPPLDYERGGNANPFASRTPEEQAALTTAAQQQTELEFLPRRQEIQTQGKIDEMRAESEIKPTKAQEAVDSQYGKEYVEFLQGGAADANKALDELSGALQQLQTRNDLTGPWLSTVPMTVRVRTNPESVALQETVESTVQRSLRVILGAQFTEKEGERLIARAFNPALGEQENAVRVGRLLTQLRQGFDNKAAMARYYEENGTLRGFTGKIPSWNDFDAGGDGRSQPAESGGWGIQRIR